MRSMRVTCTVVSLFFAAQPVPTLAQINIPIPAYNHNINGTSVQFSGELRLASKRTCDGIALGATINLADLARKITGIVQREVPAVSHSCGDRRAIHQVHLHRSGDNLGIKVDGMVGRQLCTRTKVPEVHGFKVKWVLKTVGSTTQQTNASVSAVFDPVIHNGDTVRARLISGPDTRVSNDALRGLISLFNLNGRINSTIRAAIERALSTDAARFRLPDNLRRLGLPLRLGDAKIVNWNNQLALKMSGRLDVPQRYRSTVAGILGSNCN